MYNGVRTWITIRTDTIKVEGQTSAQLGESK